MKKATQKGAEVKVQPHFGADFMFLHERDGGCFGYEVSFKSQAECVGFSVSAMSEIQQEFRRGNVRFTGDWAKGNRVLYDLSIAIQAMQDRFPGLSYESVEDRNATVVNMELARALCDAELWIKNAAALLGEFSADACDAIPDGWVRRNRITNRANVLLPELERTFGLVMDQARAESHRVS